MRRRLRSPSQYLKVIRRTRILNAGVHVPAHKVRDY